MCLCLAGLSFCGVVYYIFFLFRNEMTSDCADTIFWAQAMVTSGKIFSPTFTYAALIPFGGQTLMYPFVKAMGVTMLAQMLGMLVFAVIFSAAVFFCAKELFHSVNWALVTVFFMLATLSVSVKLREIFWGHIIYYSLGVLFLAVALFLTCKILSADRKKAKYYVYALLLGIWMLLTATDGLLSLVQCMLPVLGAVVLEWCFEEQEKRKNDRKLYLVIIVVALCGVAGYAVGNLLHGDIVAGYAQAYSSFDGSDEWTENLMKVIPQWYTLLGVDVSAGEKFMSANGLINLLRIAYATVLAVVPAIMLFCLPKVKETFVRLMIYAHWIMTGIILTGYVFGRLSGGNWRLSPLVCSGIFLLTAFLRMCLKEERLKRFGCLMSAVCILINGIYVVKVLSMDAQAYKENTYYGLTEYLKENDLTYGYATFWNAGVITLMSDSRVEVRNVQVTNDNKLNKYLYQSESYWYDDREGQDTYFLILTKREYSTLAAQLEENIGGYYDYLVYEDYYIFLYDHNILTQ
jgi:hypothetical protein